MAVAAVWVTVMTIAADAIINSAVLAVTISTIHVIIGAAGKRSGGAGGTGLAAESMSGTGTATIATGLVAGIANPGVGTAGVGGGVGGVVAVKSH